MPSEQDNEKADSLLMPPEGASQPGIGFSMPTPSGKCEGSLVPPSQLQSEGGAASPAPADLKTINVRAVADRVYELMRAELREARRRGQLPRRGA